MPAKPKERPGIILRKEARGAVPVSAFDAEQWAALPLGTEFDVKPRTKRSNPQNRMYWSILAGVIDAAGWTMTSRHLHNEIKERLGYSVPYRDMTGALRYEPDSTAFDNMPPDEFREFFDKAMLLLAEHAGFDPMATIERDAA